MRSFWRLRRIRRWRWLRSGRLIRFGFRRRWLLRIRLRRILLDRDCTGVSVCWLRNSSHGKHCEDYGQSHVSFDARLGPLDSP